MINHAGGFAVMHEALIGVLDQLPDPVILTTHAGDV